MRAVSPPDRRALLTVAAVVLGLHVIGVGLLVWGIASGGRLGDGTAFGVGAGLTAYLLGVRHAFDADHVAAIDATTRKLAADGVRSWSVGMWFALGHSTVVVTACLLLGLGLAPLAQALGDESSTLKTVTGIIGPAVASTFLLVIAFTNLAVLRRVLAEARRPDGEGEVLTPPGGLGVRRLRPLLKLVRKPRDMYPTGLLFGLGFDTATDVGLLLLAGSASVALPLQATLSLPLLFAAGMCLGDSADGVLMRFAYRWADDRPRRMAVYTGVITTMSMVVAGTVGVVVLAGLLRDGFGVRASFVAAIADAPPETLGFWIVGAFVVFWAVAALIVRRGDGARAAH